MSDWWYNGRQKKNANRAATALFLMAVFFMMCLLSPSGKSNEYAQCEADAEQIYQISTLANSSLATPQEKAAQQTQSNQKRLENRVACNDLRAQWAVANVTYFAFWAGVIGISLVYLTLRATRETIEVTSDASSAQIEEAGKVSRRELRAYIYCKPPEINFHHRCCGDMDKIDVELSFVFENNGQTPAYGLQAGCLIFVSTGANGAPNNKQPPHTKIGNYTQVHKGTPQLGSAKISLDASSLTASDLKGATIEVMTLLYYHDIYSVGTGDDANRFNDVFQYSIELNGHSGTMSPRLIKETDKKTV